MALACGGAREGRGAEGPPTQGKASWWKGGGWGRPITAGVGGGYSFWLSVNDARARRRERAWRLMALNEAGESGAGGRLRIEVDEMDGRGR